MPNPTPIQNRDNPSIPITAKVSGASFIEARDFIIGEGYFIYVTRSGNLRRPAPGTENAAKYSSRRVILEVTNDVVTRAYFG